MGIFSGIEDATVMQGGVYLLPGKYTLRIEACKIGKSRKGEEFFVAEFTILSSSNAQRPVGSRCSWMVMRRFDSFLANVKGFIAAALSCTEDEVTSQVSEGIVGPEQPLTGSLIEAQAVEIMTKKNLPFTKTQFFSAETA